MSLQRLFIAAFFLYSATALAGPNWDAIQDARHQKAAEKAQQQQHVVQQQHLQTAFERLQAACGKVHDNDDVKAACKEMLEAGGEMTTSNGAATQ